MAEKGISINIPRRLGEMLVSSGLITAAQLNAPVTALTELLVHCGLAPSKGHARKDIEGGGVYINNVKAAADAPNRTLTSTDLLFGKYLLLRKGKRTYAVLTLAA